MTWRESFLHQIDCQVRQAPSMASFFANSAWGQRRSHQRMWLVLTPAFFGFLEGMTGGIQVLEAVDDRNPGSGKAVHVSQLCGRLVQADRLSK